LPGAISMHRTKLRSLLLIMMVSFLLTPAVNALQADIDVKDAFKINQTIRFNYTISSQEEQTVTYLPYVQCPDIPKTFYTTKRVEVDINTSYRGTYDFLKVENRFKPQTCTALLLIRQPEQLTVKENLSITVKPHLDLHLSLCKDQTCQDERKVFARGEQIWIKAETEAGAQTDTSLEMPDGRQKGIKLPYQLTTDQIGVYQLRCQAEKAGHWPANSSIKFEVIKDHVKVPKAKLGKRNNSFLQSPYLLLTLILIVLALALIAPYRLFRHKKRERQQTL